MAARVQIEPFDLAAEVQRATAEAGDVGAVATFTGICRRDGDLLALTLECYAEMATAEMAAIEAEARARWPLQAVTLVHRCGRLMPGDPIVLVVVCAAHRAPAFAAAEFLMDYLKTRAPFWKREERAAGVTWVEAKAQDDQASARWRRD